MPRREPGSLPPGPVEVRRSARRRRTVTAYRDGERTVVLLPARMSRADEAEWVRTMLDRLAAKEARAARRSPASDQALRRRAADLSRRYLDGRAVPASVRWVTNQAMRWGSCTPADRTVRLSHRLRGMPDWVVDYVLVHELAHLLEPGHSVRFWRLVARYPLAERARGYLLGVAATHPGLPDEVDQDSEPVGSAPDRSGGPTGRAASGSARRSRQAGASQTGASRTGASRTGASPAGRPRQLELG